MTLEILASCADQLLPNWKDIDDQWSIVDEPTADDNIRSFIRDWMAFQLPNPRANENKRQLCNVQLLMRLQFPLLHEALWNHAVNIQLPNTKISIEYWTFSLNRVHQYQLDLFAGHRFLATCMMLMVWWLSRRGKGRTILVSMPSINRMLERFTFRYFEATSYATFLYLLGLGPERGKYWPDVKLRIMDSRKTRRDDDDDDASLQSISNSVAEELLRSRITH